MNESGEGKLDRTKKVILEIVEILEREELFIDSSIECEQSLEVILEAVKKMRTLAA